MGSMLLQAVENVKYGSENPEGAKCSLSPIYIPNRYPTSSRASSPMPPVSNHMHFGNRTLWPSGGQWWRGMGQGGHWDIALGTGHFIRKTSMEGGIWMDEWYMRYNSIMFYIMLFGCVIPGSTTKRQKLKDIYNGLLKV